MDTSIKSEICPECGKPLQVVTFLAHQEIKDALDWLLEDRKAVAGEQNINVVLARLIMLEATKRERIAIGKQQSAMRREDEKKMREIRKAIRKGELQG